MTAAESTAPPAAGVRLGTATGRWVVLTTVLGSGMAFLDSTVVNVALPRLGEDLDASFAGLSWVANGYLVTLASLILVGGAVGDRVGRRRTYLAGVAGFAAASLLCGLAPNVGVLVAARLLQGVAGAFLVPGSLAIIQASFHPDDRATAIGTWSGLSGVTTAVGPFVGGWLVDAVSWRLVFLLNLPLALLVVVAGARHLPETRDESATGGPDLLGGALGAIGLAAATYGLIEEEALVGLVGAAVLLAFVVVEARLPHPMLPLGVFRSMQFSGANLATFAVYGALGAVMFLLSLVLQIALGYSPLEAGAATVPITLVMLAFSSASGALAQRIGPRIPMTVGPLVLAVGLVLMVRVDVDGSYVSEVLPAVLVFAAGLTTTVAPLTATVLAAVDAHRAGVASGINNAVARTAGLLAVAAIPLVAGFDAGADVPEGVLVDGFHRVVLSAAGLCVAGALISWATIRSDVLAEDEAAHDPDETEPCFHCGVGAPPPTAEHHL